MHHCSLLMLVSQRWHASVHNIGYVIHLLQRLVYTHDVGQWVEINNNVSPPFKRFFGHFCCWKYWFDFYYF